MTSAYRFTFAGYGMVIGDMLGYSHSLNVSLGNYSVDPRIGNLGFQFQAGPRHNAAWKHAMWSCSAAGPPG